MSTTYTKGGITYRRDSSGKLSRVKTVGKSSGRSSSSSRSTSSTNTVQDTISKKLYGKSYSELTAGQQRAANFSITNAERQAKKSGKSGEAAVIAEFEKGRTAEAKAQ